MSKNKFLPGPPLLRLKHLEPLRGEFLLMHGRDGRMDLGVQLEVKYVKYHGVIGFDRLTDHHLPIFRHELMIHRSRFHADGNDASGPERVYFDESCEKVAEVLKACRPGDRVILKAREIEHTARDGHTKYKFFVLDIPELMESLDREIAGQIDDGHRGFSPALRRQW